MRIFHGFENLPDFVHPAVTVGSFDGVHCGHRALLGRLLEEARSNGGESIVRQCYLEDGTISSEILEVEVYNFDSESGEYYLDSTFLNAGDILYKLDGQETFTVSKRATLTGVYNMNKGYADFKQINILYQNEEYAIVKSNTKYGLSVYDYIVLNAETVSDDQFINQ